VQPVLQERKNSHKKTSIEVDLEEKQEVQSTPQTLISKARAQRSQSPINQPYCIAAASVSPSRQSKFKTIGGSKAKQNHLSISKNLSRSRDDGLNQVEATTGTRKKSDNLDLTQ